MDAKYLLLIVAADVIAGVIQQIIALINGLLHK